MKITKRHVFLISYYFLRHSTSHTGPPERRKKISFIPTSRSGKNLSSEKILSLGLVKGGGADFFSYWKNLEAHKKIAITPSRKVNFSIFLSL